MELETLISLEQKNSFGSAYCSEMQALDCGHFLIVQYKYLIGNMTKKSSAECPCLNKG